MTWLSLGYQVFDAEDAVTDWATSVRPVALSLASEPSMRGQWLRHGATWFAGVDVLDNDGRGRVPDGPPLACAALAAAEALCGPLPLHRAQVSVTYPGYPGRDGSETEGAHRYRLRRDAAHLDGLLPEGPDRRRHLREPHAYILGLPLTQADPGAAPLVVYEGSHDIMRAAFSNALAGHAPADWAAQDVTEVYQAARRQCFELCRRVPLHAQPGQAILLHRLALHGIAPWDAGAQAAPEGRAIAYFRPLLRGIADWLHLP